MGTRSRPLATLAAGHSRILALSLGAKTELQAPGLLSAPSSWVCSELNLCMCRLRGASPEGGLPEARILHRAWDPHLRPLPGQVVPTVSTETGISLAQGFSASCSGPSEGHWPRSLSPQMEIHLTLTQPISFLVPPDFNSCTDSLFPFQGSGVEGPLQSVTHVSCTSEAWSWYAGQLVSSKNGENSLVLTVHR